jgi:acetyl esterase/lipase
MFHGDGLKLVNRFYLQDGEDPANPLVSPLYADLRGLPPMLIHVGADETLLDDSTALAERAREAGVRVQIDIWQAVPHVWQMFLQMMPEARASLQAAASFLQNPA